jgi:hypothetical protein
MSRKSKGLAGVSPFYEIFRRTPPEELSEMLKPALKAAWEDQKTMSLRAESLRTERELVQASAHDPAAESEVLAAISPAPGD